VQLLEHLSEDTPQDLWRPGTYMAGPLSLDGNWMMVCQSGAAEGCEQRLFSLPAKELVDPPVFMQDWEWSPIDSSLAFIHDVGWGGVDPGIYRLALPSSGSTSLPAPELLLRIPELGASSLSWSPTGEWIAFLRFPNGYPKGAGEITVLSPVTGEVRVLGSSGTLVGADMVWSGDGRSFYFKRWEDAFGQESAILAALPFGRTPQVVAVVPGNVTNIEVAPDGLWLAVEILSQEGTTLRVVNLTTGESLPFGEPGDVRPLGWLPVP
jgi:dipeptidyl aminopeptidase/acylaminoacyl peptidase